MSRSYILVMAAAARKNQFKVVLLGEGCVGKTSLMLRYVQDKFNDKHLTTLQVSLNYLSFSINHIVDVDKNNFYRKIFAKKNSCQVSNCRNAYIHVLWRDDPRLSLSQTHSCYI